MSEVSEEAIDPALVQRMVELVRNAADLSDRFHYNSRVYEEARAIAALLPKPVDPAVLACREAWACHMRTSPVFAEEIRSGVFDGEGVMKVALAAYKAGQESRNG